MKTYRVKILIILALAIILNSAESIAQKAAKVSSGIEWIETTCDFGKIPQGKSVIAEFQFKNPSMVR